MLDVAVHCFRLKPTTFYSRFLKSDYPRKIESGDPFTIWGKSGTEIALDIAKKDYEKYRKKLERNGSLPHRSKEYWAGWALARYQWSSGKTFAEINSCVGIETIIGFYEPYHEMDIRQFCLKMDSLFKRTKKKTSGSAKAADMIKLTNIEQTGRNVSMDVESMETTPRQKYRLTFDVESEKYSASIKNPDEFDVAKIIRKISSYLEEGKKLPAIDCIACY